MVFCHKWYIFTAGIQIGGIPLWQLIIHDWSKFTPIEMHAYRKRMPGNGEINWQEWSYAWHHHYMHNPHHWEHWRFNLQGDLIFYDGIIINNCLPMPEIYIREMIADWMGASKVHTGSFDMIEWLENNLPKMEFHPQTEKRVFEILEQLGIYSRNGNEAKNG